LRLSGVKTAILPRLSYPRIADELTYGYAKIVSELARETLTIRHSPKDSALPYRQLGSFLPGEGVGGGGVHWNGQHWRVSPRSCVQKPHNGALWKALYSADMTIQDFRRQLCELEPISINSSASAAPRAKPEISTANS